MKFTKKFIALIAVMAVTLGLFSNIDDASATTSKDGYNITVSNIQVSPGQVDVGSLASLKFDFNIETQSGNAMKPGDTINLSTNIGTMFGSLPSSEIAIFSDNGQQIATAVVTGTEVKITLGADFPADRNFLTGSIYTGARLKALDNGATDGNPVTKALTIEDANANVTFKVKAAAPGTGTGGIGPSPGARTINNRLIEKQGWTSAYDTAHIKLIGNQLGSLRLFNTYNNIDSTFGTYQEQTNLMLVDKIPHNGVIDIDTISFTAVRYNWAEVPASGNPHYAQAAAGAIMPVESGSNWLPVSQYFTQITQSSSDTYDSFYAKIKAQKLSYGVFRDPVTGGDTFIANFSNDSLKYTDLEPNLGGMNKIKDIYGPNGPSQGNIVTFFAEFDTHYPEITGIENVTNKGEVSSDQASDEASVTYTIDKSAGNASVAAGTIRVKVVDEIDNTTPIKGAEFKIQTKLNGKWSDYYIRGRKAIAKSNASGEAVITGLSRGDYRLVQTSAPGTYKFDNNVFKPNPAYTTSGSLNATEGTFSILNATQPGFSAIVPNYQKVDAKIKGSKEYANQDNTALTIPANTFEVTLAQIPTETYDGVTMPQALTAAVGTDGSFEFDKIEFKKPGTYKFKVSENRANPLAGVVYDNAEKEVTVTVTNDNGTLKAVVNSEPAFKNVFNYTTANFKVKKALTGDQAPTAEEFKFELSAVGTTAAGVNDVPMPAGSVLDKKVISVNGAGVVDFGDIKFEAVGKYTYKVVELNTNALNYTYDAAEYTVIVDVTTDADNKLVATVDIQKDAAAANEIEFTNKYEVPVVPVVPQKPANPTAPKTSNKPNTGDDAGNLIMMLSMFAASAGLLGVVSYKRKLNK